MKKISFIAPSYKRATGVLTHGIVPSVVYAVHQFEADDYKRQGFNVMVIPDDRRGNIAAVRNWIKDEMEGREPWVMIDDDVRHFLFREECRQVKLSGDRLLRHVEEMVRVAKEWNVVMAGVNPATDKGSYQENTPFSTKSYVSGSFNLWIKKTDLRFDEKLPLKEDYDMTIQICRRHRQLLRFNQYFLLKDDHANVGGCAAYRTVSREVDQLRDLRNKWGGDIVRSDGGEARAFRKKDKRAVDINPIIRVPISGV